MKRGSFLKMLGIGAGAATVVKATPKESISGNIKKMVFNGEEFNVKPDPNGVLKSDYPELSKAILSPSRVPLESERPEYLGMKMVICYDNYNDSVIQPGTVSMLLCKWGVPMNYIELKGQGVLREIFHKLDDATYVGDISNQVSFFFYHSDDAAGKVRNPKGKYLILPTSMELMCS